MAPSWASTPSRRLAQTLSLALFLVLVFHSSWPYRFEYEGAGVELSPLVELFLILDPLVAASTSLAAKTAVWSLAVATLVLLVCIVIPRWFCVYVCPLGTLIDLFDWSVGRRVRRFRVSRRGWWVHLRFFLLAAIAVAAVCGVLVSGFLAAIPLLTRGVAHVLAPLQIGAARGWEHVPEVGLGQYASVALLVAVLALGVLRPRFWCAYVCPSGALLSLASCLRVTRRRVLATCTECGRCVRSCAFDAIAEDYSTRVSSCAMCRTCEKECPRQAVELVGRWSQPAEGQPAEGQPAEGQPAEGTAAGRAPAEGTERQAAPSRRSFIAGLVGSAAAGAGVATGLGFDRRARADSSPIRPPGSVPEDRFSSQCIRCGECVKVCPGGVLQPAGLELGLEGLWTPVVRADIAGCAPFCTSCGQVCPTGAIRELPVEEKRAARIGLAVIDEAACLPHRQEETCGWCLEECASAGYHAMEYIRVGAEYEPDGRPIPDTGYLAPVVLADRCVGCGLCQARCRTEWVTKTKRLRESAVRVVAGPGKEDRMADGSYLESRERRLERERKGQDHGEERREPEQPAPNEDYVPDFLR